MSNPFASAIQVLGDEAEKDRAWGNPENEAEFNAAIRVLEAGGRVDKRRAISTLATLLNVYVQNKGLLIPELEEALKAGATKEIRTFLYALPDKENPRARKAGRAATGSPRRRTSRKDSGTTPRAVRSSTPLRT